MLLGPTGAGKTTTLRLIAGLEKPTVGDIYINEADVNDWGPAERDVALVLQQYSLYPRLTVRENLAFPLQSRVRKMSAAEIEKRIDYASKTLRIEHLLDRKTDRLSGGEMQRVSIGRAIVREPQVFLMDEPLSALDAKLREALRSELKDLQMRLGATFIFVTHDQVEAMTMGDRIAVLNQGRIVQVGTPARDLQQPARHLRRQLRRLARHQPAARQHRRRPRRRRRPRPSSCRSPARRPARAPTPSASVPRTCRSSPAPRSRPRVHDIENHGIEKIVTLRVGDHCVRAAVPASVNVAVEDTVRFGWNADKVMFFDAKTGLNHRRHKAA